MSQLRGRAGRPAPALVATLAVTLLGLAAGAGPATAADPAVPVTSGGGQARDGEYIVTLQQGTDARSLAKSLRISPRFVYDRALDGFAARLTPGQLQALQLTSSVTAIEQDQVVQATQTQSLPSGSGLHGLDRIDQRTLPLSGSYSASTGAASVTTYVLDSGIATSHPDFGGRARNVHDVFGGDGEDCYGHGTHVAATIGGSVHGVAKAVQLRGVRVLDCSGLGSASAVVAAVDWLRASHVAPAVANLSLSTGHSKALNAAVTRLVEAGVPTAVAAGNDGGNACRTSPASADGVLTVAATDETDTRAPFSNHGSCVELYAPGVGVRSAWLAGATAAQSGTSMASAHVAGALALHLAAHPAAPSSSVTSAVLSSSSTGVVQGNARKTPDRLLFTSAP